MMKLLPMHRVSWTLLSLASSYPIFGLAVGTAVWGCVNFVAGLYLFLSVGGIVGLLVGFFAAFSHKRLLCWVTCVSAGAIASLSAVFAYGFFVERASGVPLNNPVHYWGIHAPIILFCGAAFVFCSIEALIYFPGTQRLPRL